MVEYEVQCVDERLPTAGHMYVTRQVYDENGLRFELERVELQKVLARFSVTFRHPGIVGYRMLDESYRLTDWSTRSTNPAVSRLVPSPWAAEIEKSEPVFEAAVKQYVNHYMVCSENECYDVLTTGDGPIIDQLS